MGINASVFSAPTNVMALGHPFASEAHTQVPGVPFGLDIHSRELVCIDPWRLKDAGVINSAFGLILGPKNHGKSATMKILSTRLMLIAAGYQQMRIAINDYKPEGKASEYAEFSAYHASKVFRIRDMSVNPFEAKLYQFSTDGTYDRGIYELGILGAAEVICEFAKGARLSGHENTALRIALHAMLHRNESFWSPHLLFKLLRSITEEQIVDYFSRLDAKLQSQLENRLLRIKDETLRNSATDDIRTLVAAVDNHKFADIQSSADDTSTYLGRILNGSFGNMFGDTHSLYDMLTQRAITKDWRGVGEDAETLMRTLDTQIKTSAIENNRLDLLPHIENDDEKHKSMSNLVYARSHSFFSEIARGTHTLNLSATHRLDSIRRGDAGSELYKLGDTIINNLGFILIGQQADDEHILGELQSKYGLSHNQTRMLTVLPKYTFAMKLGEAENVRFIQVFATPEELEIMKTNSATDRMIARPDVLDPTDLERFARENGVAFIGENEA